MVCFASAWNALDRALTGLWPRVPSRSVLLDAESHGQKRESESFMKDERNRFRNLKMAGCAHSLLPVPWPNSHRCITAASCHVFSPRVCFFSYCSSPRLAVVSSSHISHHSPCLRCLCSQMEPKALAERRTSRAAARRMIRVCCTCACTCKMLVRCRLSAEALDPCIHAGYFVGTRDVI